jgi:hypothetical protein
MKRFGVILILMLSAVLPLDAISSSGGPPDCSPQAIRQERVRLYLAAAREQLASLASQTYLFAADSERCRLSYGSKPCNLPDTPLNSTDLGRIFDYYVKQPVEAALNREQITTRKGDWSWQPYTKQH